MSKKYFFIFLTFIFFITSISCSIIDEKTKQKKQINLAVNSNNLYLSPLYAGISKNFFQEEKLKLKVYYYKNEDEILKGLVEEKIDAAILDPLTIIKTQSPGLTCVSKINQLVDYFLVSRKQMDFSWEEINKKIVIGNNVKTNQEILLEYFLRKNKIKPYKNVDIIYNIPPELTRGAFKGGTGDFVLLKEPDVSSLEIEKKGYQFVSLGKELGPVPAGLLVVPEQFIKTYPQVIQKLVNGIYKAQIWCKLNSTEEIAREVKPFFPKYTNELVYKIINRYKTLAFWAENPIIKPDNFKTVQEVINVKHLDIKVDNSFAEKAVKNISIPEKNSKYK